MSSCEISLTKYDKIKCVDRTINELLQNSGSGLLDSKRSARYLEIAKRRRTHCSLYTCLLFAYSRVTVVVRAVLATGPCQAGNRTVSNTSTTCVDPPRSAPNMGCVGPKNSGTPTVSAR